MVASPTSTPFFCIRLMVGFGGLNIEPPLFLIMLRCFGPGDYHFHLSVAHSLLWVHSSHYWFPLVVLEIWSHISHQISLTARVSTCISVFDSIWGGQHIWPGSILTQGRYHYGWLPWVDIGYFLQPYRLLMDNLTPHCHSKLCCELLPLSKMTSV